MKKSNLISDLFCKKKMFIHWLFVFMLTCGFSFESQSQTDTVCFTNGFQASLVNDSIVDMWVIPPMSNSYCGYVEKKQSSLGNIWVKLDYVDYQLFQLNNHIYDTLDYNCRDTITYRLIEYTCYTPMAEICVSAEQQFIVGDIEIPDMPQKALVSIDDNQKLTFAFSPSLAEDVMGYVICKGNPCVSLDTIWGKENNYYVCNTCDVEQINELAIMSFDSCMNTSLRSDKINNMVLIAERQDCSQNINLSWNEYVNMPSGLNRYEVHLSNNGDVSLPNAQYTSATIDISSYNGDLIFYIKAIGNDESFYAYSNRIVISQTATDTLKYMRWQNASVNFDNKSIALQIEVDNSIPVENYKLYRKEDGEEDFVFVKEIAYTGESVINIEDKLNKEACGNVYFYYLQAPDRCGNTFTSSPVCTTFKANIEEINTHTNRITWTSFNLFPTERYDIYRYEQGDVSPIKVGESVINTFNDMHGGVISSADKLYYYVTAIGMDGQKTANSSHNYLKYETLFFIPNAFDPTEGSITEIKTFKPMLSHIKKETYLFTIYNRWGTTLFSTNKTEEGWNGEYRGKLCESGVYIYKIRYINSNGKMETHSGTFMLYD